MLSFDRIDDLLQPLSDYFERFNQSIIGDMARRLTRMFEGQKRELNSTLWQLDRLRESGALYESILIRLAELTPYTERELRRIFEQAGLKSVEHEYAVIQELGRHVVPLEQSPAMINVLRASLIKTRGVLFNLTQTMPMAGQDQFIETSDLAYEQVARGTLSIDEAVKQGVIGLAEEGIHVINYSGGRVEKADVAILRNVRTGIVQTTGNMTLAMAAELGVDTVEVSAHAGARNKGTGPMNHAEWQGKVYSISGKDSKYPPLIESTGYGTAAGLLGINCRHSLFIFFEGVSTPEYTQTELDRINNTKVTYDGQQMDLYEATQKQRYIERQIRDWKRKAGALNAGGLDNTEERLKVGQWQAKARDFTKQTGLVRRYEWERVAVTDVKPKVIEVTAESRSAAKELLTRRKSEEPGITSLVVESVINKGGEIEGLDFRLKSEESLARKIATDSAKNKISIEHAAKDITDVNRYTGIFSKESLINNARLVDKNIQASGFTLIRVKNTFGQPSAYQGLHYIYQHPDGRIFELQFHTPESIKIKNQAHKLYETSRVVEDKQLKKYLDQKMAEMWKNFEPPAGWSNILDFP